MNYALIIGILLFFLSCGRQEGHEIPEESSGSDAQAPVESAPEKGSETTPESAPAAGEETELELLSPAGSTLRYLDARALTLRYQRVFLQEGFGYQHCKRDKPRTVSFCRDSIFSPSERIYMGAFDVFNPDGQRGPSNVNRVENLTLNYMRSLRSGLARECRVLVSRELGYLKAADTTKNRLIKGLTPDAAILDEFARSILGIAGTNLTLDIGSENYVKAFAQSLKNPGDQEKSREEAYVALCIAIGMDPQIILY